MRVISILTALLVAGALYLLVFERDVVMALAGNEGAAETPTPTTEDEATAVSVVSLASRAEVIDGAVLLRGRTEAARQVEVRAETSGTVISSPLRKGISVERGQLLCEIDPGTRESALAEALARLPEAEARLTEAAARLSEAQINDRAASRLNEGGFASETRVASTQAQVQTALAGVQTAQAGVLAANAAIAAARIEIQRLKIHAPFEGVLESDTAEVGSLLQPGALCGTVIQLDPIRLVGFLPEVDVDRIAVGAGVSGRLASGREITGRVTFISRAADETTRTFRTDVEVTNADLSIRDGQTVEMRIEAEGTVAHLIPQSALTLDDDGRLGVRTIEDRITIFVPVRAVRDTVDGIWVTGLPDVAEIIVVGQEYVTDGVRVAATHREATQ